MNSFHVIRVYILAHCYVFLFRKNTLYLSTNQISGQETIAIHLICIIHTKKLTGGKKELCAKVLAQELKTDTFVFHLQDYRLLTFDKFRK